jgi:hypothetical protein
MKGIYTNNNFSFYATRQLNGQPLSVTIPNQSNVFPNHISSTSSKMRMTGCLLPVRGCTASGSLLSCCAKFLVAAIGISRQSATPLRSSQSGKKADAFARRYMFLLDQVVTVYFVLSLQSNMIHIFIYNIKSSASIGIRQGLITEESVLNFRQGQNIFLFYSIQNGLGAHPVSYPIDTGGLFHQGKTARVKLTPHLHGAIPPFLHMPSLYGV